MLDIWQQITSNLKQHLSNDEFSTWIAPLQISKNLSNKKLLISASNLYIKNFIEIKYSEIIQLAIDELALEDLNGFIINVYQNPNNQAKKTPTKKFKSNLKKHFKFENYIEGKSNRMTVAAAKYVIQYPGEQYNPLYIYGATGLGKTHIMHAIGNELIKSGKKKVLYIRSKQFVNELVSAIQQQRYDRMKSFINYYQSLDALLIDDVQFFTSKERSQEEFFHTFNHLLEGKSQIVLTSDRYPKEIENIEHRLKSRFHQGIISFIEPPEFETRVGILNYKAKIQKIILPEETNFFIANTVKANARELEGALKNVSAMAKVMNSPLTVDIAKSVLHKLISIQNKIVSIENIQQTVANFFSISINDLNSKTRSRSIARPRQIAMCLTKELTEKSYPEIGKKFGNRDHTTVIHACKKVEQLKAQDNNINEQYKALIRQLTV